MDILFLNQVNETSRNILEYYETVLEFGDEESKDQKSFLKLKEELCNIKSEFEADEKSFQAALEMDAMEEFVENAENFDRKGTKRTFDVKKSAEYKDFKKQLDAIAATMSRSEDLVMEAEINIYDPITKLKMVDPVRNTICGHHYEKTSIMEAIKLNKRLRCPVAGCGNVRFVTKGLIVPDEAMKARLMNTSDG